MPSESSPSTLTRLLRSKWTDRIVYFVLVPALLLYSLWLPPASLGARLFHTDVPLITPKEGGSVAGYSGASLTVEPGAVAKRTRISMDALGGAELAQLSADSPEQLAVQSVPDGLLSVGPWHRFTVYGKATPTTATVSLPIPSNLATVSLGDLYGWDGQEWQWIPSQVSADGLSLEAEIDGLPSLLMIAQTQALSTRVVLSVSADELKAATEVDGVSMLSVAGFAMQSDGTIAGDPPAAEALAEFDGQVLLSVSNWIDGALRSDLVDNLLIDEALRAEHVANLVKLVSSDSYDGIELAYSGVDPALSAEFTALVSELATALHSANKLLAVQVDKPTVAGESWDTDAYDWQALGQLADIVRVPVLLDPAAYAEDGAMDRMVAWAVRQVNRRKLDLIVPTDSHVVTAESTANVSYKAALGLLAQDLETDLNNGMLLPGQSVTVALDAVPAIQLDTDAQVYWFETTGTTDAAQTVWLENASSLARKLTYVTRYVLGGVQVDDALNADNDTQVLQVVSAFQDNYTPSAPDFAFIGTVESASGVQVAQMVSSLEDGSLVWTAPNNPGNYVISAGLSDDGGSSVLDTVSQVNVMVPTPTFTPTPTPTNTPTATPTATPTNTPTPKPTAVPVQASTSSSSTTTVSTATTGYFGYGIQADMITDTNYGRIFGAVKDLGLGWVKQQVEWFRYNPAPGVYNWGALDAIVDNASAYGVNVLFSVVKAPDWARPAGDTDQGPPSDPNTYGTFMRELAARYKGRVKAYEIWNEQNLYYEWGGRGGKLNAAKYVELLKAAYNAVKSVDPSAVVISGALTPTGWNDGDIAIDDRLYLEQMYQAGLARYCDAIGAHPSGYNNPPDADWQTYSDASTSRSKGHPSWFFRGTLEAYRNIMVQYGDGSKRIWATEFGWASVDGLGVAPVSGYEYAADNTEAEQAQFIVQAFQWGKARSWMGPMFLWNLNFAPVAGAGDEKAAFGIVRADWGARPAYAAIRDMAK